MTVFKEPQEYRKWQSIPLGIFDIEEWYRGEAEEMPRVTNGKCYLRPMFTYEPGQGTSVWYNWSDLNQWAYAEWKKFFEAHPDIFDREEKRYKKTCEEIQQTITRSHFPQDFIRLHQLNIQLWPMLAFANILGNQVEEERCVLTERAYALRAATDRVSYNASDALHEMASKALPERYAKYKDFLTYDEIVLEKFPSLEVVGKRKQGFVFFDGELFALSPEELGDFFEKRNVVLIEEKVFPKKEFAGKVAYKGKVRGRVQKLQDMIDFAIDFTGKVLVASMTNPDYLPFMRQAIGFVTDEGGITCHAAIVARELKKPCIIGTKVATQVLKDGDLVEVDADRGVVRILQRE